MSEVVDLETFGSKVKLGPESLGQAVIVEDRRIPNLLAIDLGDQVEFILDGRFSYTVPAEMSHLFASAMAQSMAIGAGYPWLGAPSKDRPFAPQCAEISLGE